MLTNVLGAVPSSSLALCHLILPRMDWALAPYQPPSTDEEAKAAKMQLLVQDHISIARAGLALRHGTT